MYVFPVIMLILGASIAALASLTPATPDHQRLIGLIIIVGAVIIFRIELLEATIREARSKSDAERP